MADREKVIKGLHYCTKLYLGCKECPYFGESDSKASCECKLKTDAFNMLKEQDAVAPLTIDDAVSKIMDKHYKRLKEQETTRWKKISPAGIYECEKCGKHIISQDIECFKYCFNCGRLVK